MRNRRDQRQYNNLRVLGFVILMLGSLCINLPVDSQETNSSIVDSLTRKLEEAQEEEKLPILIELSTIYTNESFDKSIQYARIALNLAEKLGDREKIAASNNRIGIVLAVFEIYDDAILYFEEASILRRAIHDSKGLAQTLGNMGIVYYHLQRMEDSRTTFEEQVAIAHEINNDTLLASSYHNIGELYSHIGNLSESESTLEIALEYYKKVNNHQKMVEVLNILGDVLTREGEPGKALEKYFESRIICNQLAFYNEIPYIENQIGEIYLSTGNLQSAYEATQSSLEIAMKQGILETLCGSFYLLSEYYTKMGDLENAFYFRSQCNLFKDSLNNEQLDQKLTTLQTRYDMESKDQELQVLRRSEEIANLELEKSKLFRNFMIILITILTFFSIISLVNMFQRRKTTMILKRQKQLQEETNVRLIESERIQQNINLTKDKFFKVLTNDLIEPFRLLLNQTEFLEQGAKNDDIIAVKKNSGIIYQSSRNLFQLLDNLLQWSRNQQGISDFHPGYFDLNKSIHHLLSLIEVSALRKNIELTSDLQEALIVYSDESHILTVLRNILNNAIKFTHINGAVKVTLKDKGHYAKVVVKDNGTGINPEDLTKLFRIDTHLTKKGTANERGTGLGLLIAYELLLKNKGEVSVESEEDKGTSITVSIPKTPSEP